MLIEYNFFANFLQAILGQIFAGNDWFWWVNDKWVFLQIHGKSELFQNQGKGKSSFVGACNK